MIQMSDRSTFIIDDDFLPDGAVEEIQTALLEDSPWVLGRSLLGGYDFGTSIKPYNGTQFNHMLFYDSRTLSDHWPMCHAILKEFCDKNHISTRAVIRSKSNLTFPETNPSVEHTETPHVDHLFPHLTLLYYINDADGETILYNEKFVEGVSPVLTEMTRVSPKAGRAVLFDGLHYHSPNVPSTNYRAVINYTFIGEVDDL